MKLRLICLLSILVIGQAMAADLTGSWAGQVELTPPDGTVQTQAAYLDLKQDGQTVSGTGGTEPGEGLPLENVTFDGKRLTFSVTGPDGRVYKTDVSLVSADHLEGKLEFEMQEGTVISCKLSLDRTPAR